MSMFSPAEFGIREPHPQARYETALVCENGHLITDHLHGSPESVSRFCGRCGAPTISACPNCSTPGRRSLPSSAGSD